MQILGDSAMPDHDLTEKSLLMCVYNEGLSAAQWEEIGWDCLPAC